MADQLDIASELAEIHNQTAIMRHKQANITHKDSAFYCIECDEVIPNKRRMAVAGVQMCISCQSTHENKKKHYL